MLLDKYDKRLLSELPSYLYRFKRSDYEDQQIRKMLGLEKDESVYDAVWSMLYKVYPMWAKDNEGGAFLKSFRKTRAYEDIRLTTLSDIFFAHIGVDSMIYAMKNAISGSGSLQQLIQELQAVQQEIKNQEDQLEKDGKCPQCGQDKPEEGGNNQSGDGEEGSEGDESDGDGKCPKCGQPTDGEGQDEQGDSGGEDQPGNQQGQGSGQGNQQGQGQPQQNAPQSGQGGGQGQGQGDALSDLRSKKDQIADKINELLNSAYEETRQELDETKDIVDMTEGHEQGRKIGRPIKTPVERAQMLERLKGSEHIIKKVAKICGKLRFIRDAKRKEKTDYLQTTFVDVQYGDDVSELLDYSDLALDDDEFDQLLANGELMIAKRQGKSALGQGPIVFCLDESGSMSGEPEDWSKTIMYAIHELANDQKRQMYFVPFMGGVIDEQCRQLDSEYMTELLTHRRACGGTNFDPPIRKAMEIIGSKKDFRKADIIFITDGEAGLNEDTQTQLRNMMRSKNVHLYLVVIGQDSTYGELENIADATFCFDSNGSLSHQFTKDSKMLDTFFKL